LLTSPCCERAGRVRTGGLGPDGLAHDRRPGQGRARGADGDPRRQTRRQGAGLGKLAGQDAPAAGIDAASPLVIDLDATLVSETDKELARPTFNR
jgi:hypothetical protein